MSSIKKVIANRNPNVVHIISRGNKWAVYKSGNKKATALFQHREQAYFKAKQMSNCIIVHNKNGSIDFKEGLINYIGWNLVSEKFPEHNKEIELYDEETGKIIKTKTYLKNDMIFVELKTDSSFFNGYALALTKKLYWKYVDEVETKIK